MEAIHIKIDTSEWNLTKEIERQINERLMQKIEEKIDQLIDSVSLDQIANSICSNIAERLSGGAEYVNNFTPDVLEKLDSRLGEAIINLKDEELKNILLTRLINKV